MATILLIMGFVLALAVIAGIVKIVADKRTGLNSAERRELNAYRVLVDDLQSRAIEWASLGDPNSQVILNQINDTRRELSNVQHRNKL